MSCRLSSPGHICIDLIVCVCVKVVDKVSVVVVVGKAVQAAISTDSSRQRWYSTLDASACCLLLIMGGLHKHWNTGDGHVRWRVIRVCTARINVCSTRHVLTMVMRQSTAAKQMLAALSTAQPQKSFQPCLTHCHWFISWKCYYIRYTVHVDSAVQMLICWLLGVPW